MAPIKIAVVEDQVSVVTAICNFLEEVGFETVWAYNGEDAIRLCEKDKPNLLLMDIRMKKMSGLEVAKALPKQKIVFMSADDDDNIKAAKLKNYSGFIRKPVDYSELELKLKKILKVS